MNAITLKELNTRYDYNFSLNNLLLKHKYCENVTVAHHDADKITVKD